ncbi:hypothetical protein [Draconibacterium sp.]|uniref:hypothetical protein n=1 Tax=Draconibacterium sp. TaxID=1965318 RepID=UPI003564706E
MKKVTFLLAAILVLGVSSIAKAQKSDSHNLNIKIDKQALIAIESEGSTDISFDSKAFVNAGEEMTFAASGSNKQLWLNYSSIVGSGSTNTISAKISKLPEGLKVNVATSESAATSSKKGKTGKGYTVDLTEGGVTVVDNIGSCYTGNGANKGHKLEYSVSVDDSNYEKLVAADHTLVVTYTITEN